MFWDVLPTYIAIGMSVEEFWNGSPYLAVSYREANKIKSEKENGNAWWQGAYIYEALQAVASTALSFGKKGKRINYPTKPHRILPLTKEEKLDIAKKEREKAIRSLTAWKDAWDKKYGND